MKSRISILMFLCFLTFWSCQKEEVNLTKVSQSDDLVNLRGDQAIIFVYWANDDGAPVKGARVFAMDSNELIAETDEEGNAYIDPIPGAYRVVDPNYGTQQAIVKFPEDFQYDELTGKKKTIIGWTIDGKPIYG